MESANNQKLSVKILKISEEQIERLYKQSLCWIIICEGKTIFDKLDETMRNIKFEDNNPLKFEFSLIKDVKIIASKKINHQNYLKETDSLKASGANGSVSYSDRKDSRAQRVAIKAKEARTSGNTSKADRLDKREARIKKRASKKRGQAAGAIQPK